MGATSEIDVNKLEKRLRAEREELAADQPTASEIAELFPRGDVMDPEDLSIQDVERDVQLDGVTRRSHRLSAIEDALTRIQDGTFGTCVECGGRVGAARLEVDPAAALCVACQNAHEELKPQRMPEL